MVQLSGLTLAVHNFAAMRDFYAALLGLTWEETQLAARVVILQGELAGLTLQLCPASVAGVAAADFRHQLRFTVPDLDAALAAGIANGGEQYGELQETESSRLIALRDPDGNTLELEAKR